MQETTNISKEKGKKSPHSQSQIRIFTACSCSRYLRIKVGINSPEALRLIE